MTTASDLFASIPSRFRPEKARDARMTVHFDLSGPDAAQYTVAIGNGACTVTPGLHGTPECVVRTTAQHYVALESGTLNPQMALMTGKVKVSSIAAMMQFAKYFRRYDPERTPDREKPVAARPPKTGPLKDVRVIDLSRLLPGPMATLLMADLGADVLKVEDPASPDPVRNLPPFKDGLPVYYGYLNRGKRSVAIDLNAAEGRERFLALIREADVVIEQFRPGVMQALGLGPEVLMAANPRIIICSITGYGQTGPLAQVAGHDINYLAWTGMLDGLRGNDGHPVLPAFQAADVAGGAHMAVAAVLAALHEARNTGKGRHLDVAMTDAMFHLQALRLAEEQATGRYMADLSGARANYGIYTCADGLHLAVGALEPKFWEAFCIAVGRQEWASRILDQDQMALRDDVQALLITAPRGHWLNLLADADACVAPMLGPMEALAHPHFAARNGAGHWPVFGAPVTWPSPDLGQDG
jgi:crotonobetainyl-CoA:carnitine CoA-transferase CaiB-like acyl-CoA transferase/putative sterol carrier protein